MQKEITKNGIPFTEHIGSPRGADFVLFTNDSHTKEDVATAKAQIRAQRDALTVKVASLFDRVDDYKSRIFSLECCKPLKWYQIEQDEDLLKSEFLNDCTPQQFADKHIIGKAKATERKYLKLYGNSIYNM